MAAICAIGGLIFNWLTDHRYPEAVAPERLAAATFVAIAVVALVLTVERRRWQWALAFAGGWGLVIAGVGWFTASYNSNPTIFEWPYLSGIFAVLIAAPLFQTVRDEGAWRFPYEKLHNHAWMDAVIGAASLFFTGVAFLLAWLIAGLFNLIGIEAVKNLLEKEWFGWMLAGFAFGAAVGLLRERDALLTTLQRLVMVVFSVLAPVLAVALVLFLASMPFTGLDELWKSDIPATPLLLLAGAGAILLVNAVIGNGKSERSPNRVLQWSALALVLTVLPLALIAALSIGQRIGQYGWTPERIWGVIAVVVAIVYGAAGWWAVFKGRLDFDDHVRPLQIQLAICLCGLALFLALPILDFGAISAKSQMARMVNARIPAANFDWRAMAFDFGPAGRRRLRTFARSGSADQRKLASAALASNNRYDVEEQVQKVESAANLGTRLRVLPEGTVLPPDLLSSIAGTRYCRVGPCVTILAGERRAVIAGPLIKDGTVESALLERNSKGVWSEDVTALSVAKPPFRPNLESAPVELRKVERRQLFVDGMPVGNAFE
ncbi:DUF4153 domain-containing protein [Sphingomonas sp.]|uniref:DUF4153 domain-containing protein n=1 Tax=Sphingomonas sp. TaxID=28214 RepID=UPI00286BBA90|nr:DUF4153 domain-containing protein [Sphingomonas sp.]